MATLGSAYVTALDVAKQENPDGSIADIAEILNQSTPLQSILPMVRSNTDPSHVMTVRTGMPQPSLRRLNEGIGPTKSTNAQVEDTMCHMEDRGVLDVDTPAGGNLAQVRINENKAKIQGFGQYSEYLMWYGATSIDE